MTDVTISLPPALAVLNRIFAREKTSFLQYLKDAWVWTHPEGRTVWNEISRMIDEEQKMLRQLAHLIVQRKGILPSAVFDERFTESHFLSLAHLLPRLLNYQRWLIQELQKDMSQIQDPEALNVVRTMLEMKQRHLASLEELQKRYGSKQPSNSAKK